MIWVTAICKNEAANVEAWVSQLSSGVEGISIVDTGSTDNTLELIQKYVPEDVQLFVQERSGPMDFADARNMSASVCPPNALCLWLDFDERVDATLIQELNQLEPFYCNSVLIDWVNYDGTVVTQNKAFRPSSFTWYYTCHEVLKPIAHVSQARIKSRIQHVPDKSKPREYLPLLRESHRLNKDDRSAYYLIRELCFNDNLNADTLTEAKALVESFASQMFEDYACLAHMSVAKGCSALGLTVDALRHSALAEILRSDRPEPYLASARVFAECNDVVGALHKSLRALDMADKPSNFIFDSRIDSAACAADLAASSCLTLGLEEKGLFYAHVAKHWRDKCS